MKFYRTRYASSLAPTCYFNRIVPEGFLTTCSFDFLTDDQDTKVFVMCIFIWSYVIPLTFIVYFYSQLLKSIRNHERMLREQVGQKLRDSPTTLLSFFTNNKRTNFCVHRQRRWTWNRWCRIRTRKGALNWESPKWRSPSSSSSY